MKRFPFRRHELLSILAPEPAATETTNELPTEAAPAPSSDTPTNSSEVIGALAVHRETEDISTNAAPGADRGSDDAPVLRVVADAEQTGILAWLDNEQAALENEHLVEEPASPVASPAAQNDAPEIASPVADQRPRDTVVLVMAPGAAADALDLA
jgi:hypothetical protein